MSNKEQAALLKYALENFEEEPLTAIKNEGMHIAALFGKFPSIPVEKLVRAWWEPLAVSLKQKKALLADRLGLAVSEAVLNRILEKLGDCSLYKLHFEACQIKQAIGKDASAAHIKAGIEAWAKGDTGPGASTSGREDSALNRLAGMVGETAYQLAVRSPDVVASVIGSIGGGGSAAKRAGSLARSFLRSPHTFSRYFGWDGQWIEGSPRDRKQLREILTLEPAVAERFSYLSAQELEQGLAHVLGLLKGFPLAELERVGEGIAALIGKNPSFERIHAAVYGWWDPQGASPEQKKAMLAELLGRKVQLPWLEQILEMRQDVPLSNLYAEALGINEAIGEDKSPKHVKAVVEAWAMQDIGPIQLNLQPEAAWAHFLNFAAQSGQLDLFARGFSAWWCQEQYSETVHRPGPWALADAKARDARTEAERADIQAQAAQAVDLFLSKKGESAHFEESPDKRQELFMEQVKNRLRDLEAWLVQGKPAGQISQVALVRAEKEMLSADLLSSKLTRFSSQRTASECITPRHGDWDQHLIKKMTGNAETRRTTLSAAAGEAKSKAAQLTREADVQRLATLFLPDIDPAPRPRDMGNQSREERIRAIKEESKVATKRPLESAPVEQIEEFANSPASRGSPRDFVSVLMPAIGAGWQALRADDTEMGPMGPGSTVNAPADSGVSDTLLSAGTPVVVQGASSLGGRLRQNPLLAMAVAGTAAAGAGYAAWRLPSAGGEQVSATGAWKSIAGRKEVVNQGVLRILDEEGERDEACSVVLQCASEDACVGPLEDFLHQHPHLLKKLNAFLEDDGSGTGHETIANNVQSAEGDHSVASDEGVKRRDKRSVPEGGDVLVVRASEVALRPNGDVDNLRRIQQAYSGWLHKKDDEPVDSIRDFVKPHEDSQLGQFAEELKEEMGFQLALVRPPGINPLTMEIVQSAGSHGALSYRTEASRAYRVLTVEKENWWQQHGEQARVIAAQMDPYGYGVRYDGAMRLPALLTAYGITPADPKNGRELRLAMAQVNAKITDLTKPVTTTPKSEPTNEAAARSLYQAITSDIPTTTLEANDPAATQEPDATQPTPEVAQSNIDSIADDDRTPAIRSGDDLVRILMHDELHHAILGKKTEDTIDLSTNSIVYISQNSSIGQWVNLYRKAIKSSPFRGLERTVGLDLTTAQVRNGSIHGSATNQDGVKASLVFSMGGPEWRRAARPIIAAADVIDPGGIGLPYGKDIPVNVALAFYGFQPPKTVGEAQTILDTLTKPGLFAVKRFGMPTSGADIETWKQEIGTLQNLDFMLSKMSAAADGKKDDEEVELANIVGEPEPDSPFGVDLDAGVQQLSEMTKDPTFLLLRETERIDPNSHVLVTATGVGANGRHGKWVSLTSKIASNPQLDAKAKALFEVAKKCGGGIRSNGRVKLAEMLNYHGFKTPKTAAEARAAIVSLNRLSNLVPQPDMLDYRGVCELLNAGDWDSLLDVIRQLASSTKMNLLDYLGEGLLANKTAGQVRAEPEVILKQLLVSPRSDELARSLLRALDWYGGDEGEKTSPGILNGLKLAAINLSLDPHTDRKAGYIAGYKLAQDKNWGLSYRRIRSRFESHLVFERKASGVSAPLAAYILLRKASPDFLIRDIPSDLLFTSSLAWVNYQHGVNIAEGVASGSSSRMTFKELVDLAAVEGVSEEMAGFIAAERLSPVLAWAVANDVIAESDQGIFSSDKVGQAISAFETYENDFVKAVNDLFVSPPSRRAMAKDILMDHYKKMFRSVRHQLDPERIMLMHKDHPEKIKMLAPPGPVFVPGPMFPPPLLISRRAVTSLVEVYMSGELKESPDKWIDPSGRTRFPDITQQFTKLPDIGELYQKAFDAYWEKLEPGYEILIKSLIATLSLEERISLERGRLEFYTLRKETGKAQEVERQKDRDALTARCGFIIHAEYGGGHYYYEVFPLVSVIRQRTDLTTFPIGGVVNKESERTPHGSVSVSVLRESTAPFDWDAYSSGSIPKENVQSAVIMELQGDPLDAVSINGSAVAIPRTLWSSRSGTIAKTAAQRIFPFDKPTILEAARETTELEKARDAEHPAVKLIKDVLPFYRCVENIESGDRDRVAAGVGDCATDSMGFFIPGGTFFAGAVRTFRVGARIGLRAVMPQFGRLAKGLVVASLQNLNPLDGVPTLLKLGGMLAFRWAKAGYNMVEAGLNQLKKLTGKAGGYDFIKGKGLVTDMAPGTWKPHVAGDQLRTVGGAKNVPVRNVGSELRPSYRRLDTVSKKPYGPPLMRISDDGKLADSLPSEIPLEKTGGGWTFRDPAPDLTQAWGRKGDNVLLEVGDAVYRKVDLGDGTAVLRRTDKMTDDADLIGYGCRQRRTLDLIACVPNAYTNRGYSKIEVKDEVGRDAISWFADRRFTAGGAKKQFVQGNAVWEIGKDGLKRVNTPNGQKWLWPENYKRTVKVKMVGGNDIFKQVSIEGGIVAGMDDTLDISAVVAKRRQDGVHVIVTQADDGVYYKAVLPSTYPSGTRIQMKKFDFDVDVVKGRKQSDPSSPNHENNFLVFIYNGSYDANLRIKQLGMEAVAKDFENIQKDLLAGKNLDHLDAFLGGPFDLGTTREQAALFCKYFQSRVLLNVQGGVDSWTKLTATATEFAKEDIATKLNVLYGSPDLFNAKNVVDQRFVKSKVSFTNLSTGEPQVKNLAFTKIKFKDKTTPDVVLYSLSGYKNDRMALPLAKRGSEVFHEGARYINVQPEQPAGRRIRSGDPTDPHGGAEIFVPDLSDPTKIDNPGQNFRYVDSERNILNWINNSKNLKLDDVESFATYSTFKVCQSCTFGFGKLKSAVPADVKVFVFEGT